MANTGNIFIDVMATQSWLDVGKDRHITYYFDEFSPAHLWTTFEKAIFRSVLQEWANVANITFQEVSSAAGVDLFETWVTPAVMTQTWGHPPPMVGVGQLLIMFRKRVAAIPPGIGITTGSARFIQQATLRPVTMVTGLWSTKLATRSGSRIRMGARYITHPRFPASTIGSIRAISPTTR